MLRTGERYQVEDLVPHRGMMSLLERVDGYGEDWLRAGLVVRATSPFAGTRGVPGWVGLEYMAQAASAFAGIEQVQGGAQPSIGLLIGARYYRCMLDVFPFGMDLQVFAKLVMRDAEDFAAYECTLSVAEQTVARCTLKAYRPRDISVYLSGAARG